MIVIKNEGKKGLESFDAREGKKVFRNNSKTGARF